MGIEVRGFDEFISKLGQAPANLSRETDRALARGAHIVRSNVVKGITHKYQSTFAPLSVRYALRKQKSGGSDLILVSGIRGRKGIAGLYVNSFSVAKRGTLTYEAGSNHPQARALEFGSNRMGKNKKGIMPARPHLQPAFEDSKPAIYKELREAVARALR